MIDALDSDIVANKVRHEQAQRKPFLGAAAAPDASRMLLCKMFVLCLFMSRTFGHAFPICTCMIVFCGRPQQYSRMD